MTSDYRALRDELVQKRDGLNGLIEALTSFIGDGAGQSTVPKVSATKTRAKSPKFARRLKSARRPAATSTRKSKPSRRSIGPDSRRLAETNVRQNAVLDYLKRHDGIATRTVLKAAMPKEPGLNDEQRDAAYRNTMTRLKAKGLIDRTGDTWSLVGIGTSAA